MVHSSVNHSFYKYTCNIKKKLLILSSKSKGYGLNAFFDSLKYKYKKQEVSNG